MTAAWERITSAWRTLTSHQRAVAVAALALLATMLLPWYSVGVRGRPETLPKSALFVFSWVEAAVLVVCLGVLALLLARAERRPFHLPGGDGLVVSLAGAWACLLVIWRLFDKPSAGQGVPVGIDWGIWVALGAAVALASAGLRLRAAHTPEPPLRRRRRGEPPAGDDLDWVQLPEERPHLAPTRVMDGEGRRRPSAEDGRDG